jgi:hypothetical protein
MLVVRYNTFKNIKKVSDYTLMYTRVKYKNYFQYINQTVWVVASGPKANKTLLATGVLKRVNIVPYTNAELNRFTAIERTTWEINPLTELVIDVRVSKPQKLSQNTWDKLKRVVYPLWKKI